MQNMNDTQFIRLPRNTAAEQLPDMNASQVLEEVYSALTEKGYNPVIQIVGYIISGDPTYITNHQNARAKIMKVERDELLTELVEHYIDTRLS